MCVGRTEIDDGEPAFIIDHNKTIDRSTRMEHVVMRNIMRLIVAGSVLAIAVNILIVFSLF